MYLPTEFVFKVKSKMNELDYSINKSYLISEKK